MNWTLNENGTALSHQLRVGEIRYISMDFSASFASSFQIANATVEVDPDSGVTVDQVTISGPIVTARYDATNAVVQHRPYCVKISAISGDNRRIGHAGLRVLPAC